MAAASQEDPGRAARRLRGRIDLLERLDHAASWLRRAPKPPPPPLLRALETAARGALARLPAQGTGCADCPRRGQSGCACGGAGCGGAGCGGTRPCGELRGRAEAFARAFEAARGGAGSDSWADLWSALDRLREGLGADIREHRAAGR